MKKAVKRRIQALEIGIQACVKRMLQLTECVKVEDCPLCEAYRTVGNWTCDQCPAYKKTDDSVLTCNVYADIIEDLIGRLGTQKEKWEFELRDLRGTPK